MCINYLYKYRVIIIPLPDIHIVLYALCTFNECLLADGNINIKFGILGCRKCNILVVTKALVLCLICMPDAQGPQARGLLAYRIAGFFHSWKFSLFNFSWVDILVFGATLHMICIVEEILVELILAL